MHPIILIIDADEIRAQRVARILTLADYHPLVVAHPYQAFERILKEACKPEVILLGQRDIKHSILFQRLMKQLMQEQQHEPPSLALPSLVPNKIPLYADPSSIAIHHRFSTTCIELLETLWHVHAQTRRSFAKAQTSLTIDVLPSIGLQPRISQSLLSRNSHFRQILKVAYRVIGETDWGALIGDVGLAHYRNSTDWPLDNDERTIPAHYLSCLHQAVALSRRNLPAEQLHLWSQYATEMSVQRRTPSLLTQQALKLLPQDRLMITALNAFVKEMNDIRGEELHFWRYRPNSGYWLIHYSNLYAYGRIALNSQPGCAVWIAALECMLKVVNLHHDWKVSEKECSCQTLTGHCLFAIEPL